MYTFSRPFRSWALTLWTNIKGTPIPRRTFVSPSYQLKLEKLDNWEREGKIIVWEKHEFGITYEKWTLLEKSGPIVDSLVTKARSEKVRNVLVDFIEEIRVYDPRNQFRSLFTQDGGIRKFTVNCIDMSRGDTPRERNAVNIQIFTITYVG